VALRECFRLNAGAKLSVDVTEDGRIVLEPRTGDIRSLRGIAGYSGPPKTLEEIDAGIAAAVSERARLR
jgi:bifunctional DNA-binding transcriptional regulator/antitoxin component of YhaV-PrlF toxin-antitoxin module